VLKGGPGTTLLELLTTLWAAGVKLTPQGTTLHVDAPTGALTPALRAALRTHKAALLDLVEEWSERAAIAEYCGGLSREDAERLAWDCLLNKEVQCHL
jgi:hypothetical protein